MHLALNGHKTSSMDKKNPREHREWVEDLVEVLFQVKNDDFREEITSKLYSKYVYQSVLKGRKSDEKEAILKTIDGLNIDHIYGLNPLRKNGWYFFCPKKTALKPQKEKELEFYQQNKVF